MSLRGDRRRTMRALPLAKLVTLAALPPIPAGVAIPLQSDRLVVLYDADCGFCRVTLAALLRADRERRLRPVAIQSPEGEGLLAGMPEAERLAAAHAVAPGGPVLSGAAAVPIVFGRLPWGGPVARLGDALPGLTERVYHWVADHRTQLSSVIPSRAKEAARGRIARHA